MEDGLTLVTGAGGFIGGHFVGRLVEAGVRVRAVDRKPLTEWYQLWPDVDNRRLDLASAAACAEAAEGACTVYNLAADMGGMGFIELNKARCMLSVLINTHMLQAACASAERFFFASSACVYAADKQLIADNPGLREEDAYPAMPEDGYGWEKLFSERMCRHFREDFGLATRVGRYHNVYGPMGTWDGGREKAPAAICRKVPQAQLTENHEIEIWGDGQQTRSFMYVSDCLDGTIALTQSMVDEPINIGSAEIVTINQLVDVVEDIAGIQCDRRYNLTAPRGVMGRTSDNARVRALLGWEPSVSLRTGLEATYAWVYDQAERAYASAPRADRQLSSATKVTA